MVDTVHKPGLASDVQLTTQITVDQMQQAVDQNTRQIHKSGAT